MTAAPVPEGRHGPRGLAIRTYRAGYTAGVTGRPVTACPYDRDRPIALRSWILGYAHGRRDAGTAPTRTGED